ncbi:ABC transporter permease subunit [Phytoactinopolyspora sp. XMNu-373]|uniref:ABC transporter permease subunit n=1 Tax=Phytoactinopolyspora mesophila TaxID=2650750 RepID=A0A7K3M2B0_9ACTN|nr:carbohydrate ABC transporter permease [Phytoactinopolyspora mesophila]NDL57445.1 ABC transporter permease subunit [Phytoactinopolyspora mesophila]
MSALPRAATGAEATTTGDHPVAGEPVSRPRGSNRVAIETKVFRVLRWLIIAATVFVCAGPLLYGIFLSMRSMTDVVNNPLNVIPMPGEWDLSSYGTALRSESDGGFGLSRFMGNSAMVALGTMVLVITFSVLGAYAAVRLRFFGRDTVNGLFLAVYLVPTIVLAVPLFVMFSRMGLRRSLFTLVIIYLAQTVPVALYMLRNYFIAVPPSVEEAAMIDGCTRLQTIRKVVIPMAMPGIVATALYVFMIAWNEFLFALLFLVDDRPRWTVSLGVHQLSDSLTVSPTILMAGSIAITVPIVVVFMFAQKALVSGLTSGAEKG